MPSAQRVYWSLEGGELRRRVGPIPEPGPGEVVVQVEGCGVCHTDVAFIEGSVRPQADPVVPGHEIAGTVIAAGEGAGGLLGRAVLAPAVLPCGNCPLCREGRGNVCPEAMLLGSRIDGGFATHVRLPARPLAVLDLAGCGLEVWEAAVIADAVTTPLAALRRARAGFGDRVVIVGAGGLGSFAVQIASALGARVIAADVDGERLERARRFGADQVVDVAGLDERAGRDAVRKAAAAMAWAPEEWKVMEMSGTAAGQRLAFELLTPRGVLGVVGYTRERVPLRLSNVMALEAEVIGTWGAPPERYPEAIALVRRGAVRVRPFVRAWPLSAAPEVIEQARAGRLRERPVLRPAEGA